MRTLGDALKEVCTPPTTKELATVQRKTIYDVDFENGSENTWTNMLRKAAHLEPTKQTATTDARRDEVVRNHNAGGNTTLHELEFITPTTQPG